MQITDAGRDINLALIVVIEAVEIFLIAHRCERRAKSGKGCLAPMESLRGRIDRDGGYPKRADKRHRTQESQAPHAYRAMRRVAPRE